MHLSRWLSWVAFGMSESACNGRDLDSVSGSRRSLENGMAAHSQYSYLNSMARGAWQASPVGYKESDTTERHFHFTLLKVAGK